VARVPRLPASLAYTQNDTYRSGGPAPTGENAKRKQFEYDALHRLTSVCEVTSATGSGTCGQTNSVTGYWTEYTYDPNNRLTGVTQNAQSSTTQTRAYVSDDLGRMTSETNPESGTTSYTYDTDATCGTSKGDMVKKVDAVGNTICFAYDALHRVTSITYPSGSYASVTPGRYFVYDSATVDSVAMINVKSRMAEAYTCFSPCSTKVTDIGLSYTARGEVSDVYESTPHSGGYYHSSASYWANGVISVLNGALGYWTNYSVDGEGRVYSAGSAAQLTSTSYNTASLPTAVNFASGDSDTFTYDPNTNRMTQYSYNVNGNSVIGKLTWNPIGTLASLAITDPFNSADAQSCTYTHDDLSRIASANCGSIWSQTFSYDAFGNINKSGTSSFGATYSSSTNRMTLIGSSTPSYDSNGNVTNDFLNTYAWDSNGRPVTADGVGLTYDALGRMAEQNRSGVYTQIQYSPTGFKMLIMTSGTTFVKAFVPMPAGTAEVWSASMTSPYYRHSDWLGSSRLASSSGRAVLYDGAYGPFGEAYAQTGTADPSFTGMNQDTASNMYDFPAREYGTQGRWPSPDPAGISSVSLKNPQTWNRYAYVGNNPLVATDPTGTVASYACAGPPCSPSRTTGGNEGGGGGVIDDAMGGDSFAFANEQQQVQAFAAHDAAADPSTASATPPCELVLLSCGAQLNGQSSDQSSGQPPYPATISIVGQQPVSLPGSDSIGVQLTLQLTDQNGQPFPTPQGGAPGDAWTWTEDVVNTEVVNGIYLGQVNNITPSPVVTLNDQGEWTDTIGLSNSAPTTAGYAQTVTISGPLGAMTGQQYQFAIGYFVQATGPNQGVILGSNGVQFVNH